MSEDYGLHFTNEKTDLEGKLVKFKINVFLFCHMKHLTEAPGDFIYIKL